MPELASTLASTPLAQLLESLAAKTPTPGGGAVAGLTGATGAALAQMVVAYSLGKKDLVQQQPALQSAHTRLQRAREIFLELAEEDAQAYGALSALRKLPDTDPRRAAEMPAALEACVQIPLASVAAAADLAGLTLDLAPITNRYLRTDLAIAALLADAAARGGALNVKINTPELADPARRMQIYEQVEQMLRRAASAASDVQHLCTP